MLQAANLTFGYAHDAVVRDVSIDVADDGFVGIIGPNGSGKTTLLRLMAGTRTADAGRVTLDGVPLATLTRSAIARRMAVVPQETQLAFEYTVLEVVLMGRYPHLGAFAVEGPADIAIAREALASTGTLELERRPFSTLSGGEKQRVIIAAALAQVSASRTSKPSKPSNPGTLEPSNPGTLEPSNPGTLEPWNPGTLEPWNPRTLEPWNPGTLEPSRLLLLDEPTAALDLKYQLGVASLLRSLHQEQQLAIVISTHDLNFAAGLCRSLVMLKQGRVIAAGPVDDVLTSDRIRELYDVDAEVARHPRTGYLTVTPVGPGVNR